MNKEEMYSVCAAFHGHSCGGLLVGFRAALYAMELLGIEERAGDEELVCVAENDACGVDAIQALLGCTAGKGNLIFRLRGKQAFSFFDRKSGKAFRIVLKEKKFASKEEKQKFMREAASADIFSVEEARFELPREARIYRSMPCANCDEVTAEPWLRVREGKLLCLDCAEEE